VKCKTDDGNRARPGHGRDGLCKECAARPYGTEGPPRAADLCDNCYAPQLVWRGSAWREKHLNGSVFSCRCSCHPSSVA
jgi:hypothetical protein